MKLFHRHEWDYRTCIGIPYRYCWRCDSLQGWSDYREYHNSEQFKYGKAHIIVDFFDDSRGSKP
jgi:hypothetical protein